MDARYLSTLAIRIFLPMELAIKRGHDVSLDNSSVGSSECALWVCDGSSQSNNQTGWEVKIEVNDQEGDYAVAGETAALAPPDDAKTLELVRELRVLSSG